MKELIVLCCIIFCNPNQALRVQEAEAFVQLQEAKVVLAEIQYEKNLLKARHLKREFHRFVKAHLAVSEAEIADAEFDYKTAELDCKASQANIIKAKAELEISKIRLERMKVEDSDSTHLN